jgi:hypothetical protein
MAAAGRENIYSASGKRGNFGNSDLVKRNEYQASPVPDLPVVGFLIKRGFRGVSGAGTGGFDPASMPVLDIQTMPPPIPELGQCAECARTLPMSELMPFPGFYICPECKPLAVSKLARGEAPGSAWRDRNRLVVAIGHALPERCLRCNGNCEGYRLKRELYWHHPAYYLTLFLSPIIYVLVAILIRKKAKVELPLCPEHRRQRTMRLGACWGVAAVACFLIFLVAGSTGLGDLAGWLIFTAILLLFGAIVAGVIFVRVVEPVRITATHLFLKGARKMYLAELPVWPRE